MESQIQWGGGGGGGVTNQREKSDYNPGSVERPCYDSVPLRAPPSLFSYCCVGYTALTIYTEHHVLSKDY